MVQSHLPAIKQDISNNESSRMLDAYQEQFHQMSNSGVNAEKNMIKTGHPD